MDGRTICDAMVAIDEELAVLTQRRRLLAELLATYQIQPPAAADVEADRPAPAPKKKPAPYVAQPANGGKAKWDYPEVAKVITVADERGQRRGAALNERYGVSSATAQWLVKRCREMSLIPDSKPFTREPIERAPFDPQRARDEAAGPPVGRVQPLAAPIAPRASSAEPKPERFSTDAVASMLGGVA